MHKLLSQCFILIGYCIFFISRFKKNKDSILLADSFSRGGFLIGYALLGSVNGIEHTFYGIVRNIVGELLVGTKNVFLVMLLLLIVMYGESFDGITTIALIMSGIINLYCIVFLDVQGIRLGTVFASICNIVAFIMIGSYVSVIGEVLCGVVGIVSFVRGIKEKRSKNKC